jgi:hypothetical protein
VTRLAVDVARCALLEDVGDHLTVAVDQPVGEVVLERLPHLRVGVLGELAETEPALLAHASGLVHRQDAVLVLGELDRELPALDLEDDPDLDPRPGGAG